MADDLYSIERREVEEQSSRTVKAGSKTASGYRLLPLLPQFYDLLEERKRMVQEYMEENGYTDLDIRQNAACLPRYESADTVYSKGNEPCF